MFKSDYAFITSACHVDIGLFKDILNSDNLEALHAGLESADWINLSDINSSSTASHGLGTSLSDISEARDENLLSTDHDISSSVNSINKRVFASVDIVELWFGNWVIDIDARA